MHTLATGERRICIPLHAPSFIGKFSQPSGAVANATLQFANRTGAVVRRICISGIHRAEDKETLSERLEQLSLTIKVAADGVGKYGGRLNTDLIHRT